MTGVPNRTALSMMTKEHNMVSTLFAFFADRIPPSTAAAREREVQAYYDEHENAAAKVIVLKWVIAALLLFVGFAAWAGENDRAAKNDTTTLMIG
jgi:hypothetical protein